jgi:hypothetical protein
MNFDKLNSIKERIGSFIDGKWNSIFQGSLLRITFFSGLPLLLLISGAFVVVFFLGGPSARTDRAENGFYLLLREYDQAAGAAVRAGRRRSLEELDKALDQLEKKAEGVESWLSVLKRRRNLARLDSRLSAAYQGSARRASAAYPYSEPLSVLAAAALVHNTAITKDIESELRPYLTLLSDPRFSSLRLSLHILLGDMKDPKTAAALLPYDFIKDQSAFQTPALLSDSGSEALALDLAIVKILQGDSAAAAAGIQSVLGAYSAGGNIPPSDDFIRFAAEFYYDYGSLQRSAGLFAQLPNEAALGRQADALWLAGFPDSARALWAMLPGPRAMYNCAISAETPEEYAALLHRLASLPARADGDAWQYGLVRYSRLQDASRAIAVLEAGKGGTAPDANGGLSPGALPLEALIDLEILKRRTEAEDPGRLAARTWLLLGQYPGLEELYQWGAWYFDFQRNYRESDKLLQNAGRYAFMGQWLYLHEALRQIREGNMDDAEELLASIPPSAARWPLAANLGRILETRHAPARAIEQYEAAAALAMEQAKANTLYQDDRAGQRGRETASRIQTRIAQCLKSLGRTEESRRVLQYALDLNPENLSARLELHRLE